MKIFTIAATYMLATATALSQPAYQEQFRPKIHFSTKKGWMNDPNGMVYNQGAYHLFFQYYPDSTVWGPMHWGHATSADMVHWKEGPVALYPDSIGYIFSGSAVVDKDNTSGFGRDGVAPLVAIYTQHDIVGERMGSDTFQTQSIAYSLDNGKTFTKYSGNPVLKNPGIMDFRDPKFFWHGASQKWVMVLAVLDHVEIYSSPNLKQWDKESEFGKGMGAHGGVWECPDLFSLQDGKKMVWVMLVSNNPGGPNGGSGTQYFTGNFDGKSFSPYDTTTKWLDYGPDNYAGVTFSNTGNRKLLLGWMSNWDYAQVVPATTWRSANTLPRELGLKKVHGKYYLSSNLVKELNSLTSAAESTQSHTRNIQSPCIIKFDIKGPGNFECIFSNDLQEQLVVGFDASTSRFYIDRGKAGSIEFSKQFTARPFAPRISQDKHYSATIVIDHSSIELFADNGLTTMTSVAFPSQPYNQFELKSGGKKKAPNVTYCKLKSIHD